jgi:hypothetical protein
MHSVASALEGDNFRGLEMLRAAVLGGIGGPALTAVDQQGGQVMRAQSPPSTSCVVMS